MSRHFSSLLLLSSVLLFSACTREESTAFPEEAAGNASDPLMPEVVVNVSELPTLPETVMKWNPGSEDSRGRLIIRLDKPEQPWDPVFKGIAKAYVHCADMRMRWGDAEASAFPNYMEHDFQAVVAPVPDSFLSDITGFDTPDISEKNAWEGSVQEDAPPPEEQASRQKSSYPITELIRSIYMRRGIYYHTRWRIRKEDSEEARNRDLNAFARMAKANLRQRRAFTFVVDDDIPCGEVFNYLHSIRGMSTLAGVSFSMPANRSEKGS